MSDLRHQLDEAAAEHRRGRYPGDLAAELLPEQRGWARLRMSLAGLAAMAALIALVLFLVHRPGRRGAESVTIDTTNLRMAEPGPLDLSLPAMPSIPTDVEIIPQYQVLTLPGMPSMPGMPSENESIPQGNPSTQEAV
jgi:hypothetical protein